MRTPADILTTLNALSDEDRRWIIGRLPAQSKSRLLAGSSEDLAPEQSPAAARTSPTTGAELALDTLSRVDAQTLARVLKHEPVWLIAALVYAREWPWRAQLLQELPPATRAEVERSSQVAGSFTPHLMDTLARLAQARTDERMGVRGTSRFEALVARLGASRAKKRLTLHL